MKYLFVVIVALCHAAAFAQQAYPNKPVRLISPFPPGGGVDATSRVLAQKLTDAWKQQVIVDNRTGAGTTLGTEIAARAAPDGYTLLLTNNALAISAGMYRQLRYNPARDLLPITEILRQPFLLLTQAASGAKTVKELIALAKAKPEAIALANTGIGSGPHLAGVLLANMAGVTFNHIPYKGGGPAIQDLIAGRIQALITTPIAAMPHVQSGRLRALGVTSGKRSPTLPDLATLAESGVPGYDVSTWYMLLMPAGVPANVVSKVHADSVAVLRQPDAVKILASEGAEMVLSSPKEAAALLSTEMERWAKTIKSANVKAED